MKRKEEIKEKIDETKLRHFTVSELFEVRREHLLYPTRFSTVIVDQITNELARRLYTDE